MKNHWAKVTWILNYINMQESYFMGDYYFFFNTIYIMGETPEEWKNSIVIAIFMKGGKQKVENYSWKLIVYLMSFIKYDKVFNENWKHKQNNSFWFARMDSEKADVALIHCLQ